MKKTTSLALLMLASSSLCLAETSKKFVYNGTISILPNKSYDIEAQVDKAIAGFRENGMPQALLEQNRVSLRSQLSGFRDGLTVSGESTIVVGEWGRYTKTFIPDLGTRKAKIIEDIWRDDMTVFVPHSGNDLGRVVSGNEGNNLANDVELALFADRPIPTQAESRHEGSSDITESYLLNKGSRQELFAKIVRSKGNGHVLSASIQVPTKDGRVLATEYKVNGFGKGCRIDVSRYVRGRMDRKETYVLQSVSAVDDMSYKDILRPASRIIDARLGTDPIYQVSYDFNGELPSLDALQALQAKAAAKFDAGKAAGRTSTYAYVVPGLALVAVGLGLARGRRRMA